MLKNVVKIKITTDTDDLRTRLDDLYRATETLRENVEQAVGAINLTDPDMREEWELICDVKSNCADALYLVTQIGKLKGEKSIDIAGGPIGWWRFSLYCLPAEITLNILDRMDRETLARCIVEDSLMDTYLVTHTDDIVRAIREYLPTLEEKLGRIQEMEQQARKRGERRQTVGWSTAYVTTKQTTLEI